MVIKFIFISKNFAIRCFHRYFRSLCSSLCHSCFHCRFYRPTMTYLNQVSLYQKLKSYGLWYDKFLPVIIICFLTKKKHYFSNLFQTSWLDHSLFFLGDEKCYQTDLLYPSLTEPAEYCGIGKFFCSSVRNYFFFFFNVYFIV